MKSLLAALAFLCVTAAHAAVESNDVSDLPLTEVQASGNTSQMLAVFVTGDGGWASLDRNVAERLAAQGLSTVGFDSRRYFWQARTPQETTLDLERVLRHYLAAWRKSRIVLIGYSFGADVLPFVVNRLPPDLRARVSALILLGVETHASFEVHIADWLPGIASGGPPVAPELNALGALPVLCIYGEGEHGSLCLRLPQGRVTVERIGDGHHFSRDYTSLAERILAFARGGP